MKGAEGAFGADINYAQITKLDGSEVERQKLYSPPRYIRTKRNAISDKPDVAHVSASYAEWQNLTVRTSMRRFTRLTNAVSK